MAVNEEPVESGPGQANEVRASEFVVSLDFELLWGVRDHCDREIYGRNILGGREAIPRILELFAIHGVSATWAIVGFLFCESRDELISLLPSVDLRPAYFNMNLSNYSYLSEVGKNEKSDPYYFAPSIIKQIAQGQGQEIATHTLSHYYCLEDGQTLAAFEADLRTAVELAASRQVTIRSIAFPRNQYSPAHLEICRRCGISAYRGNPSSWAYYPVKGAKETPLRRALRLTDAYTGFLGDHSYLPDRNSFHNVPASRFLRPRTGWLAPFHSLHLQTLMDEMTSTAKEGRGYHLWWHPHNFGSHTAENLAALRLLLNHFRRLNQEYGMLSRSMSSVYT